MAKIDNDIHKKVDEVLKKYQPNKKIDDFASKKIVSITIIGIILIGIFSLYQTGWIKDTDGDGVFDNNDFFPYDFSESMDSDGDGIGDNSDNLPNDSTQYLDTDKDGYGDNPYGNSPDKFPDNPHEWFDSDNDGIGDNSDIYAYGNGGIKASITKYEGDEINSYSPAPYFIISYWYCSSNGDDFVFAGKKNSSFFYDEYEIMNPFSTSFDVAENIYSVKVEIELIDYNSANHEKFIDINGDSVTNYTIVDYFYPKKSVNPQWNIVDGNLDLADEYDATIHYKIEIIEI